VKKPDMTQINSWIFDLDNTLYSAENKLFSQVDQRMGDFISQKLGVPLAEAKALQKKYFHTYGTTLRGLMTVHDILPDAFLSYVHDVDFTVLSRNDDLVQAIKGLDGVKIIYTNATRDYALKVLDKIGLGDLFRDIYDIESANYRPKPHADSYHKMVRDMGVDPQRSAMVEDIALNLVPARDMGMKTIWVPIGPDGSLGAVDPAYIDFTVTNLAQWLKTLVKD